MDIASVFELLSKGKIISINSRQYGEYAKFLQIDEVFETFQKSLAPLGYRLNGESGYYYLSKKRAMSKDEIKIYLNNHQDAILAVSILR